MLGRRGVDPPGERCLLRGRRDGGKGGGGRGRDGEKEREREREGEGKGERGTERERGREREREGEREGGREGERERERKGKGGVWRGREETEGRWKKKEGKREDILLCSVHIFQGGRWSLPLLKKMPPCGGLNTEHTKILNIGLAIYHVTRNMFIGSFQPADVPDDSNMQ